MAEIKCPHCGEVFQIDESDYQKLLSVIRNEEFEKELARRLEALKLASEAENKLLLKEYLARIEKLEEELKLKDAQNNIALTKALAEKEQEIQKLLADIKANKLQSEIDRKDAIDELNERIVALTHDLELAKKEAELSLKSMQEEFTNTLHMKEEEIAFYKDLKTRTSNKLLGESLEQHCEIAFRSIQPLVAGNVTFGKDNDASSGSKGDYIYRELTDEGAELLTIMFEMKNEGVETTHHHKNEDFFKELDKDRKEKGCEYAILVSTLEPDNELYNAGIVDVSYAYPKMFVVRPQCFIPIITILRNAALRNEELKNELLIRNQENIDITHFEEKLKDFQEKFSKNYMLAAKRFNDAIDEIDKTIKHLIAVKEGLIASINNLRYANDKLDDLTIRKLTYNNPTMKKLFEEAGNGEDDENNEN